jgi:hypothetical protein
LVVRRLILSVTVEVDYVGVDEPIVGLVGGGVEGLVGVAGVGGRPGVRGGG